MSDLRGVSCPTALACYAVGSSGTILATTDGGQSWQSQNSGTSSSLYGASCPTISACWAVGHGGTILTNIPPAPGPADRCDAPDAKIVDGFAGTTYVKLRIQQQSTSETWVCFRADGSGSTYFGGQFVIDAGAASVDPPSVDPPSDDPESGQCASAPGNEVPGPHPLVAGSVGDEDDPPYVPVLADSFSTAGEAWVCLQVGDFKKRVIVKTPTAGSPDADPPSVTFNQDSVAIPAPDPDSGPSGYASSTCQEASGGTTEQLVNADVADGHAWLYTHQPIESKIRICVRAEGPLSAGGMLELDAGSVDPGSVDPGSVDPGSVDPGSIDPGSPPTFAYELADDSEGCSTDVLTLGSPASVNISRSSTSANPASVCLTVEGETTRVTVGTEEDLTPPSVDPPSVERPPSVDPPSVEPPGGIPPAVVTWTPDPGTPGLLP